MKTLPSEAPLPPVPPIDAHTHLFPPEIIRRREQLLRRDPWFGQAFGTPKAKMIGEDSLLASMEAAGYAMSVVLGWPWRDQGLCREHNAYLADVARRYPSLIAWLGIVNPCLPDASSEIRFCADRGAAGFGELNADGQGFDWADPNQTAEAFGSFAGAGLPVLIHTSEPVGHSYAGKGSATPDRLLRSLAAFPGVQFIMAHWGGGLPFYELMPEVRELTRNVVYDSAASTYLFDFRIFPVLEQIVGPERLLFATDYPVLAQGRFLQRVLSSGLSDAAMPQVLAGNSRRVFNLKERTGS
ncbi:MAG TPA: amidohydrolase family protein [Thermomicrobiales bacterium]|nr:amidohydrolase family protein [Thermomicrobiales bacterium]